MIDENIRNAMYDVLFECQGGVESPARNTSPDELMYQLAKKLGLRPVSIKPFYTVHWAGDSEISYPHVKSHLTGRRYTIKTQRAVMTEPNIWRYVDTDKQLKDVVANYERERGIVPST